MNFGRYDCTGGRMNSFLYQQLVSSFFLAQCPAIDIGIHSNIFYEMNAWVVKLTLAGLCNCVIYVKDSTKFGVAARAC